MPDAGTGAAAAAAAAASGAATAGDGTESSRHRHRAQQGDAERPEPGAAPPQASSGVLGESRAPLSLWTMRFGMRGEEERTGERDVGKRDERRTIVHLAAPFFCLHEGVPKLPIDQTAGL